MSKKSDTTTVLTDTDATSEVATTTPEVTEEVTEEVTPRNIGAILEDITALDSQIAAEMNDIDADAAAKIADINEVAATSKAAITEKFASRAEVLAAELADHPQKAAFGGVLARMGFGKPEAAPATTAKSDAKPPAFALVNRETGEQIKDSKGHAITYSNKVTGVAPSLKEVIGDNVSAVALKDLGTGIVLADILDWRTVGGGRPRKNAEAAAA